MVVKNKIAVIGCGKVGYSHLEWLASRNFAVIGYDSSPEALVKIRSRLGQQFAASSWAELSDCTAAHICVPTDPSADGSTDLSIFESVIDKLCSLETKGALQVVSQRSTCPPGTADRLAKRFTIASYGVNPSFLRKSAIERDTSRPERIAYGGVGKFSEHMGYVYRSVESPRFISKSRMLVELLKYTENSLDSVLLSFWNEMLMYARDLGISTEEFAYLLEHIGDRSKFTSVSRVPGRGFGMWCLPKDLQSLIAEIRLKDYPAHVLVGAQSANELAIDRFGEGKVGSTHLFAYRNGKFTLTLQGLAQLRDFLG